MRMLRPVVVLGLCVLVLTDASSSSPSASDGNEGRRHLVGDALVVLAACLYAMCNVAEVRARLFAGRTQSL